MAGSYKTGRRFPVDSGFTLVEVLVSMTIAVILFGSVYFVYTLSSRSFRLEDQVMRAMERSRFALEQLRRDIGAAAFLATPDSTADDNVCPKPTNRIYGIYFERIGDVYANSVNANVQPSSVTLFGAYPSSKVFFTQSIVGAVVTLQNSGEFLNLTQAEFDSIFSNNHMLRIVNSEQYEMYFRIQSSDFAQRQITLQSAPPVSTPPDYCGIQGYGVGLEVNAVGYVRYILRRDTRAGAPQDSNGRYTKIDLVREELDPSRNPIQGSRLIIAEYIADLQFYDFVQDQDLTGQDPAPVVQPFIENVVNADGTGLFGTGASARPQDLRFVTVTVTARTIDEDPDLRFVARTGAHAPLDMYDADTNVFGAARTTTLASRVDLMAFRVRNVK